MIRDQIRRFGCGMNNARHGAAMKHCKVNGLDFFIYRMGAEKIKRIIKHKYDITLDIEGKSLDQITREAMDIEYQQANPNVKKRWFSNGFYNSRHLSV